MWRSHLKCLATYQGDIAETKRHWINCIQVNRFVFNTVKYLSYNNKFYFYIGLNLETFRLYRYNNTVHDVISYNTVYCMACGMWHKKIWYMVHGSRIKKRIKNPVQPY